MHYFGVWFVVLAAMLWGISGGLAGILMEKGWDPLVISFYRGAVGLVCLSIWLMLRPKPKGEENKRKTILWSVLAGIGVAGNFSFYFLSISQSGVAVASTLMYTAPLFVFMISFFLNWERATTFKVVSIFVVMIGITLLTNVFEVGLGSLNLIGILSGLLSGLSYTLFIFGFKFATEHGRPPFVLTTAFAAFTALMLMIIDLEEMVSVLYSDDLIWFITLGIIGAGISFFAYLEGLKKTKASLAAVIAMVEPVTASLFGVLILGEVLTFIQVVGILMILVTITLLSKKQS
ncbi:DMT family transporter [Alkalihalobacillus sp. R86527]|uniref:DMT family transporter n=1 Tax=Alkalihalobacillus sp. R86527 TaxID=3093863 RepID=UPI0036733688